MRATEDENLCRSEIRRCRSLGAWGASRVWHILTVARAGPAPRRNGPSWREFLTAQAAGIIACDFLHIDLVDLRRVYALVFLEHGASPA